jgi:hypothetical protein
MSYPVLDSSNLLLTKLTARGRQAIAAGNFEIKYYSLGDSEIDYASGGDNKILSPKDRNPIPKHQLSDSSKCEALFEVSDSYVIKAVIFDEARERGFFDSCSPDTAALKEDGFILFSGQTYASKLDGSKIWDVTGDMDDDSFAQISDGDVVMFKLYNTDMDTPDGYKETSSPMPYIFFSIKKNGASPLLECDRFLPFLSSSPDTQIPFFVFPGKSKFEEFFFSEGAPPFWDPEKLRFFESCDTSDVDILNMNIAYCRPHMGASCQDEDKWYQSQEYLTTLKYLDMCLECVSPAAGADCSDLTKSLPYKDKSRGAIIHYSNNGTRNEYGEFFYIDETRRFIACFPHLMYHRRHFPGKGDVLGMRFISSPERKLMTENFSAEIYYHELMEDPDLVYPRPPISVGKVFPDLKITIIEDEEIIAALTYKSNRNWTLPPLEAELISPLNGIGTGFLKRAERLYMTYMLKSDEGVIDTFPNQKVIYLENNTSIDRDIFFRIEDTGLLPYMRDKNESGYDGYGFSANDFFILYQKTQGSEAPDPENWRIADFTFPSLKAAGSLFISPQNLERQLPSDNGFFLSEYTASSLDEGFYSHEKHCIPCSENIFSLGSEQFMFGNVAAYIGAEIFKKMVNITISREIDSSSNPTWGGQELRVSEIAFYNSRGEMLMITKPAFPIVLREGSITEVEVSYDF